MIQKLTHNDTSIRFSEQGEGKPVVLLHGYLESLEVYESFAKDLSNKVRVICIDLPGHGESDLVDGACSMEIMGDAVNRVIEHLKLEKIHLFGHSMGGYAALAFAHQHPEKLDSFSLLHSTPNPDTEEKQKNRLREIELVKQGKRKIICKTSIPNTFATGNLEKFAHEVERVVGIACRTKPEGIIAALEAMMARPDRNEFLTNLQVPKYSIIGKEDNFIPYETALEIARRNGLIPLILESSGHMGFIEQGQKCAEFILQILKESEL